MRVHVLRNPAGGGRTAQRRSAEVVGRLRGDGHTVVELTGESATASAHNLAAAVAADEIEHIVLAGGDGLVHLAIQHLAGTAIPVTLAPAGTGNDFATALGIDQQQRSDLAAPTTAVDLIETHDAGGHLQWVASIAIAGFPAAINDRANSLSLPLGAQIYTLAAALELPRFRRQELELRLDNYPIETGTAMLAIGNTKLFGGGMLACPDALPTDGLLHLTSIQDVGRLGVLPHLIGRAGGTADRREVLRRSCVRIDIDTPDVDIWADGERVGRTPMSFRAVPKALHVTGVLLT